MLKITPVETETDQQEWEDRKEFTKKSKYPFLLVQENTTTGLNEESVRFILIIQV